MATEDVRDGGAMRQRLWDRLKELFGGRIPTTAVGVERVIALIVAGLRVGTFVQMAPSFGAGVAASPRPALYLLLCIAATVMVAIVSVRVLAKDTPMGTKLYLVDVGVAAALLLAGAFCVSSESRVGDWVGFMPAYALSVLCGGASIKAEKVWVWGLVAVTATDLVFRWPGVSGQTIATTVGNQLTYIVLVVLARVAAGYLRRVAADGDAARATAADLARQEEERRAQIAFHNGAAVMRLLADPDLSDDVRVVLQQEADREARRMRSYLQGREFDLDDDGNDTRSLVDTVRSAVERYSDLPLHTALDLAEGVQVSQPVAGALDHALASLLLNTRDHSGAARVVVHADSVPVDEGTQWIVTVHDDGRGFDDNPEHWGVGLREVVHGQLRTLGVDVVIRSKIGQGSTAVLSGVVAATVAG